MASAVDICNLALTYLGDEATITNLDPPEGSAQADHCARFFPHALKYMLEQRPWSFATRRIALAELETDKCGWAHAYAYPGDCVRVVSVTDPDDKYYEFPADFIVEAHPALEGSRVIRTDACNAVCRYVHDCANFDSFSEAFGQALAYYLAHLLAGPIESGSTGMKASTELLKMHQITLMQAMQLDAQQSRHAYDAKANWSNRYYRGARHG